MNPMNIYVKVHKACNDIIVAVCDEDVMGKTHRSGNLTLTVTPGFYKGTLRDIGCLESLFSSATILNIVGRASVEKAIACGVINKENVLEIGDTLHAQMVVV